MFSGGRPAHVLGPVPEVPHSHGRDICSPVINDTDNNVWSNDSSQYDSDTDSDEVSTRITTKELPDWSLGSLLVCFVSLLDNCQVTEAH